MSDDFTPMTAAGHWLGWLGDDPAKAVRDEIEGILRQQVPSARLAWVRLTSAPEYLTGGRRIPDEPDKIILTRAALAAPFVLEVHSDRGTEQLTGVFSWVAAGLDGERRDRVHFDLGAEFEWAAEQLKSRIYELDGP